MHPVRCQIASALRSLIAVTLCVALPGAAEAQREPSRGNLAIVAAASASYTSGDTSVSALSDGHAPRSSYEWSHGTYGNWNRMGTQWVQYEWPKEVSTDRVEVYWWADNRGIDLPSASRLLYWDGEAFKPVPGAQEVGVKKDQFNVVTFDKLRTTKLRLEMDSDGEHSTGILEWRVLDSGDSPAFAPVVLGDVDRVVMLGGKTYLNGSLRTMGDPEQVPVLWSTESGPGKVEFADAGALHTTATFSELGEYVLKLTAGEAGAQSSTTLRVRVESPPAAPPLGVVNTSRYKVDSPLWNHRVKAIITAWIPHCVEKIEDPNVREGGLNNFLDAAKKLRGEPAEPHRGYVFSNAWVHQTVESMCIALMVDPQGDEEILAAQEKMQKTLDKWVPIVLAAQEPDGYLQTAFTLNDRMDRWRPEHRTGHEGYVAGYFLESAINHYMLTDGQDRRLYDAAKKLADCWNAHIGPEPGKQPWWDEHQEMEQALVRFGRFVNDVEGRGAGDKYIRLAKFLLDCRGGGSKYSQSHVPVQQQYEAVGHAVRAVYSYSAMADVATETGDLDYRSAVKSLWDNIVNRKYYVTGGIGSGETSEGFGADYSLRHEAYCESCSSCGLLFMQHKMNLSYHDAKFVDLFEETFYNALLGSLDSAGENFYYDNPLVGRRPRYPWHVCPCCVGNIPRTLLMLPTWTYVTDKDGVFVNLFLGGTTRIGKVRGTELEIVQETNYPWDGKVRITVNPASEQDFAVRIRSPQRSVSDLYSSTPEAEGVESVAVNGTRLPARVSNGYVEIRRLWKPGDTIELDLPMPVQRVKCIDRVEANRGRVALRRGPLVYNIETVDGNNLDAVLPPDAPLTTEWRNDLLGGVVVIKGEFADGSPMIAAPNYARNNRGGGSAVWIKDR
ncbi:MAG: glycoside hydrolase family 127 protein [Planctomycetales bacterium]|nr:glycoside hydrolase family 127 protein [Planctomycetales bacterium]